jgi:predicted nucleic acid-binding Zn ribbon protein
VSGWPTPHHYDSEYGCLPLDYGGGYMLAKCWTGAYCRYFTNSVLPLNPGLEAALTGKKLPTLPPAAETKPCEICGKPFHGDGRQRYCSEKCAERGRKKSEAARARKYRRKRRSTVTGMPL